MGPTDVTNIFLTFKRGNPILQQKVAQNIWSQSVLYREVASGAKQTRVQLFFASIHETTKLLI